MRAYFIILCLSALMGYTHGGLLKDVFGKIHETAHNIREDVRNVLHKDEHPKNKIPVTEVKTSTTEKINSEVTTPDKKDATTEKINSGVTTPDKKDATTEKVKHDNVLLSTDFVFPTEKAEPQPTRKNTVASMTEASTMKKDKDPKDERNFAGGCASGFKKSADGRCQPTF